MSDDALRIAHVITKGSPMGGSQLDTLQLARYQHRHHHVEVIMGNHGELAHACGNLDIPNRVIPIRNSLLSPLSDTRSVSTLVSHFRETRPQIVHTHTSKAGILARAAAYIAGTPVVIHTLHIPPWRSDHPIAVQRAIKTAEAMAARWTDHFVAVAPALGDDFVRAGICDAGSVSTIGSAIDFASFPEDHDRDRQQVRERLGLPPDAKLVISVANLEPRKRYDVFLDSLAMVMDATPNVYALIAGVGEMDGWIRNRIHHLNLDDRILLLGRRDDVPSLLAASDIFMQTSELEGLSRSLLEAMYSRMAVIATDANATSEIIRHGDTGILVPPGDPASFARGLRRLLQDEGERRRLGESARSSIGGRMSGDAVGAAHDVLYSRLLAAKLPPGCSTHSRTPGALVA